MTTIYTIDDFLAGKVSIRCDNEEQQKAVLKICKENGITWRGRNPIDMYFPCGPVFTIGYYGDGRLTHGIGDRPGMNVVDFDEIILSHASRYQIIIESNGDTTTAKMAVNGKEVKTTTAKRNPSDKANFHIGAQTAFDRLWEKKEKPVKKDGFKVGDRVVINAPNRGNAHTAHGKHGTIVSLESKDYVGYVVVELDESVYGHDCNGQTKSGCGCYVYAEKLRHEQPAKQKVREVKRHAKVGEWVKIVKAVGMEDELYKNGYILKVKKAYRDGKVYLSCGGNYACPFEYVVLEGYQP